MDPAYGLQYIINHVFLPPKLPQSDDSAFKNDSSLTKECRAALKSFQVHLPTQEQWRIVACIRMVSKIQELRDESGDLILGKIEESLEEMNDRGMLGLIRN